MCLATEGPPLSVLLIWWFLIASLCFRVNVDYLHSRHYTANFSMLKRSLLMLGGGFTTRMLLMRWKLPDIRIGPIGERIRNLELTWLLRQPYSRRTILWLAKNDVPAGLSLGHTLSHGLKRKERILLVAVQSKYSARIVELNHLFSGYIALTTQHLCIVFIISTI